MVNNISTGYIYYYNIFCFTNDTQKRMKEQEKARDIYLSKLKPGDKVIIISGIYGIIKGINNNIVKLEISKGVIIEIDKESIMGVLN